MEEGDYWERFEISENESDNEIQSEYTDTDSSDDSDIISDTDDIGSYSEEIDEDDDNWQVITESDEVPADVPTQKCHGAVALLSKKTLGGQRVKPDY
uniref:Uncharacterized protein n=1 Tax=Glossina palpalis gambiensis TaxID=67801 RepID=A0A1B0BG96_9MUSC